MKPKYHKKIREWVDKHLGDLAPDVLSEEVKRKILWKITRKKLRKARKEISRLQGELAEERKWPWERVLSSENFVKAFNPANWYHADCEKCRNSYLKTESNGPNSDSHAVVACCIGHPTFVGPVFCGDFKEREAPTLVTSPRFCYECVHSITTIHDCGAADRGYQLCAKGCHKLDPAYCGHFIARELR